MDFTLSFLRLAFIGYVALFPPVNPIGTAIMLSPRFGGIDPGDRKRFSAKIAVYCLMICLTTLVAGSWIFKLFSLSLPVVQIAGGILLCRMGWNLLSTDSAEHGADPHMDVADKALDVETNLFYPFAFPMTTGAGTISVLLTLSAHGQSDNLGDYLTAVAGLAASVLAMCVSIYLCYAYTPALMQRLGSQGARIVNQLSSFLVFCVGIQIAASGVTHFMK